MENPSNKYWYAIYTRYKCEKRVVDHLLAKDIDAYTPMLTKTKKYQRKTKTHHYPLLSNYAFVCISQKERIKVLNTQHVLGFVRIGKEMPTVKTHEIEWLKRITGELVDLAVMPSASIIGEAVEIASGALTGIKGTLIGVKNKREFIVSLDSIQCHIKLIINPADLHFVPLQVA